MKFICILLIATIVAAEDASLCGKKEADPAKTCISVRLPWQETPIYFCTEPKNVPFKKACSNPISSYCSSTISEKNSLLVATPWDCCPLSSSPDPCFGRVCPSAPFNRTCKAIQPDVTKSWECCPTYVCDEENESNCPLKRLSPECQEPPKGKKNCIAFRDENGCCPKFQCEGEGKKGQCPAEVNAAHFGSMMKNKDGVQVLTSSTSRPGTQATTSAPSISSLGTTESFKHVFGFGQRTSVYTDISCVGDYNCPGDMKCCSPLMTTYMKEDEVSGGIVGKRFGFTPEQPIYGQCVQPVFV